MEDEAPDEFSPEEICNSCGALEGTVCVRGRAETRVKQVSHLSQVRYGGKELWSARFVDGEMVLKCWFSNLSMYQDHLRGAC